jgi:ABC-type tungstate transport system permease subunit
MAVGAKVMMRYIHKWHTPIVVRVHEAMENYYYAPWYNPKHVPVIMDLSTKMHLGWYTDEDSQYFFTKWRR